MRAWAAFACLTLAVGLATGLNLARGGHLWAALAATLSGALAAFGIVVWATWDGGDR